NDNRISVVDAKKAIQARADHFQKWYDGASTRNGSSNTSDGLAAIQAQLNNLGREIKKVNEKVYVTQVGCELCNGPHYTKDCPLKEEGKTHEEEYYTQFGVPLPQAVRYRAAGLGFYQRDNGKSIISRMKANDGRIVKQIYGGIEGNGKAASQFNGIWYKLGKIARGKMEDQAGDQSKDERALLNYC
ncbi:hypothetical protein Tco_0082252, partial [Tanacetum coccineum]